MVTSTDVSRRFAVYVCRPEYIHRSKTNAAESEVLSSIVGKYKETSNTFRKNRSKQNNQHFVNITKSSTTADRLLYVQKDNLNGLKV